MKKLLLPAVLLLLSSTVWAQYLTGRYGTPDNNITTDGYNTALGGLNGCFFVGPDIRPNTFTATRTNAMGATAGLINNEYTVTGSVSGRVQEVRSVEVGSEFIVVGSILGPGGSNLFYQRLTGTGAISGAAMYYNGGYPNIHIEKLIKSASSPGNLYAVGYVEDAASRKRMYVMKLNSTGGIVWSEVFAYYNNEIPHDIIEAAKPNASGKYELVVVGEGKSPITGLPAAFACKLDASSGAILNPFYYFGAPGSTDAFTCIKNSGNKNVDASSSGYVVGGYTDVNGSRDFWFVALDKSLNVTWSQVYDYNNKGITGASEVCNDIIEHWDASIGKYEYFLGGYTDKGYFGDEDMLVIHTDEWGTAGSNDQRCYGVNKNQRCIRLDADDVSFPGLRLFGYGYYSSSGPLGGIDNYIVKVKFDGTSDCPSDIQQPDQTRGPGLDYNVTHKLSGIISPGELSVSKGVNRAEDIKCLCAPPPLLAHWNFTNGSLVDDVQGWTATIFGGVTPTAGKLAIPNTAYLFDGSTGYMRVASDPLMDLTSWTLTALVRPDGFWNGPCQGNAIIYRGDMYGPNHYCLEIFDNPFDTSCATYSPSYEVFGSGAAGTSITSVSNAWNPGGPCAINPCVSTGTWYCVWASYDGVKDTMSLYVNGTLRTSFKWGGGPYGAPVIEDLFIGHSNNFGLFHYYFNGAIDDIAIYSAALDPNCLLDCSKPEKGQAKMELSVETPAVIPGKVIVRPNPATNTVSITTPSNWTAGKLMLMNAVGQVVRTMPVAAGGTSTMDVSDLPAGIYMLRASNNGQTFVEKIVKQ